MNRPRLFKALRIVLRIAWSVAWSVVAVLLVALWVRSNYSEDLIYRVGNGDAICFESRFGQVSVDQGFAPPSRSYSPGTYHRTTRRHADEGLKLGYYKGKGGSRFVIDSYGPGRWRYAVPHWFVSLFSVSLASVVWLPPRFNLRTLLMTTTVVAVLLGAIAWLSN